MARRASEGGRLRSLTGACIRAANPENSVSIHQTRVHGDRQIGPDEPGRPPVSPVLKGQVARLEHGRITPPTREAHSPTTAQAPSAAPWQGTLFRSNSLHRSIKVGSANGWFANLRQVREKTSNGARLCEPLSGQIPGHIPIRLFDEHVPPSRWRSPPTGRRTDYAPVPSSLNRAYRASAARTQAGSGSILRPTAAQRVESSSDVSSPAAIRAK